MKKAKIGKTIHFFSHILLIALVLAEIFLTFFLRKEIVISCVKDAGWVVLFISAIFGWLPILEFRRKGGVAKKQSYVKTTRLVRSGVYAIIRHPQFLGGMLLGLSLILVAQHWLVAIVGIGVMLIFYLGIAEGDKSAMENLVMNISSI